MATSDQSHCCEAMAYHAEYICPDTDARHDGDPLACPDRLVVRWADGTYGLLIHDGGSSRIDIACCPWCGQRLPSDGIAQRRIDVGA